MGAKTSGFDDEDGGSMCDINVTPLVDVVLVLLIVFMITVPALVGSAPVKVDLPTSSAIASAMEKPEQLPVQVFVKQDENGTTTIYLGERKCTLDGLRTMVSSLGEISDETPVHISADQGLVYRDVITVMDVLTSLGIHKLSLETKHVGQ